jgi:glycosyltransferase involved in cell wall biosynthesis
MVGWLRWEKGYEYGLEAIRLLLDEGVPVQLEILGEVPAERRDALDERARILHTIRDLGLEDDVRLAGGVTSAQIAEALLATDVLMHPSLSEGIPVTIVEAMGCEVPVVATDCGGVTEALADEVEGFVVPSRNPRALSSALERLWRDPQLRSRMGKAGRAKVLSEFTLRDEISEHEEMCRAAAAGAR